MEQTKKQITVKDLLESGAHFGHQRHRWNPKMKRFIYKELNGIYIIDLSKTMQQVRDAVQVVEKMVSENKSVLFVGTKKQAKEVVRECAEQCAEFYVCERWLGGMLTNLSTIRKSVKKLEGLERDMAKGGEGLTKKEMTNMGKMHQKLDKSLSGIRAMRKLPGLLIVVDPSKEHLAVAEARRLGIPVMALVDTNCDPDPIDYVIACNDDALKSIKLILSSLSRAIVAKKKELNISLTKEEKKEAPAKRAPAAQVKEFTEEVKEDAPKEQEVKEAAEKKKPAAKKAPAKKPAAKKAPAKKAEEKKEEPSKESE